MVRTPSYDKNGIKKGAWSAEEDHLLRAYITRYGHWNWRELPKFAGLKRCGKSCRLRWMNYLRPNLKHGSYTKEEEDLIIQLHQKHGNKWAILASKLPGRTDNEIKNHWHTHLKKRVAPHKSFTNKNEPRPQPLGSDVSADGSERSQIKSTVYQILESCPLLSPEVTSTSTPMSRDLSASTLSSFEIPTVQFDNGGWEEIFNSSELFAELASFSPLDLDAETMNNDQPHATYNTFNGEDSAHPETPRTMDVYREIHFHDDDFWTNSFSDNNQVLLSSCVNYYDDNVLDFFCDHAAGDHGGFALQSQFNIL